MTMTWSNRPPTSFPSTDLFFWDYTPDNGKGALYGNNNLVSLYQLSSAYIGRN